MDVYTYATTKKMKKDFQEKGENIKQAIAIQEIKVEKYIS